MKLCTRCILPDAGVNIVFDAEGVCNFCRTYDRYGAALRDLDALRPLLQDRFDRVRGRYAYDCLVGLSGGKDSSYVAHRLVTEYKLKTLLVTYDNGFLTDFARENIRTVAETLGQDHLYLVPDPELYRPIYVSSVKRFAVPCVGCTFPGMVWIVKLAIEKQIPLLVHGRSPPQMFKDLTEGTIDPFLRVIWSNFKPHDPVANKALMMDVSRKMIRLSERFVREPRLKPKLRRTFQPDLETLRRAPEAPEMIGLFIYEPYDELGQMDVLEGELGWKRPPVTQLLTHQDCVVHDAVTYLYTLAYGQSMLAQELSTMIREASISREEALRRLEEETTLRELSRASLEALCEMTGMTADEVLSAAVSVGRKAKLLKAVLKARNRLLPRARLPIPRSR